MKKINLLVIEDNKDLVVTMNEYFKENSEVNIKFVAEDGEEAIRLITKKKEEYDLILLEPLIPRRDGFTQLSFNNAPLYYSTKDKNPNTKPKGDGHKENNGIFSTVKVAN